MDAAYKIKRLVFLFSVLICISLCACAENRSDKIQQMLVGDRFVYSNPEAVCFESHGVEFASADSGLLEFYEDGTFFLGMITQWRFYKDGELCQNESLLGDSEMQKFSGTFELKKSDGDIWVRLYATEKNDEKCDEVKEYAIHMQSDRIQSIGRYQSLHYLNDRFWMQSDRRGQRK